MSNLLPLLHSPLSSENCENPENSSESLCSENISLEGSLENLTTNGLSIESLSLKCLPLEGLSLEGLPVGGNCSGGLSLGLYR
ncbi:hypothetical protein [Paenibacillus sp. OSY-SE]|uniref:hypothetical protein n=1 Tax=Paenibacillus sp. OSY-SE TaxID=1196323 RepID=UPI0012F88C45|nr:hypothetical protein [Paenibacillus sp. OSY-SE]